MTKDYAKGRQKLSSKRNTRYSTDSLPSIGLPSWAWMLLGLVSGVAISAFIFWKVTATRHITTTNAAPEEVDVSSEAEIKSKAKSKNKDKTARTIKTAQANPNKKTKIIKTDQIDQPQTNSKHSGDLTLEDPTASLDKSTHEATSASRFDFYTLLPTISVDTPESESTQSTQRVMPYIIQAGSFKTRDQAEQLKASLALQGLEARIQTVTINPSESWYRVYMGPFDTKADALGAQKNLEESDTLNSVILKVRV